MGVPRSFEGSARLLGEARRFVAGGVTSAVRAAFRPAPLYFERGQGAHLYDVDGNAFLDYTLGWGALILGHAHPEITRAIQTQASYGVAFGAQHAGEIRVARRLVELLPCADLVAFSNTGSEAVAVALRLARAHTGRPLVVKFEGHYHGWGDAIAFSHRPPAELAGPRESPRTLPLTEGQAPGAADGVRIAPWNDAAALERLLASHRGQVAAVVLEPYPLNAGLAPPEPGFLRALRDLTAAHGVVLIFDEVITGFRLGPAGAQGRLGVTPDLAVFGKAVAAGLPVSVVAGRGDLMNLIAEGRVAHVGTFNGNPLALAAAEVALDVLTRPGTAARLEELTTRLVDGLRASAREAGVPVWIEQAGAAAYVHFRSGPARDYRALADDDDAGYLEFVAALAERGVFATSRGLWYLSTAHTAADVDGTVAAAREAFAVVGGRPPGRRGAAAG